MTTVEDRNQLVKNLENKEYRDEFAAELGTGIAYQIRMLRDKNGWTQQELGNRTGKKQESISQLENPNYGHFTLNTLTELAKAFDVGLLVKFVAFSELIDWNINLTPERLAPPSFEQEKAGGFLSAQRIMHGSITTGSTVIATTSLTGDGNSYVYFSSSDGPSNTTVAFQNATNTYFSNAVTTSVSNTSLVESTNTYRVAAGDKELALAA